MSDIFPLSTSSIYDIRSKETFYIRPIKSMHKDTESLSFFFPKIWALIPENIELIDLLSVFKITIKQCKPSGYPCTLCVGCISSNFYAYIDEHILNIFFYHHCF